MDRQAAVSAPAKNLHAAILAPDTVVAAEAQVIALITQLVESVNGQPNDQPSAEIDRAKSPTRSD